MLGLQETHSEENEFCLDDFRLAFLYHNGRSTFWIRFPINLLYLDSREFAVFAKELKSVDVPPTCTTLLVTKDSAGPQDLQRA